MMTWYKKSWKGQYDNMITFLDKLGPKTQNCSFQLKFGT